MCFQQAVRYLKKVVERGPWMRDMREGMSHAVAGDYRGALALYSRLAEVMPRSAANCEANIETRTFQGEGQLHAISQG